jgi:hypothetical protein
MDIDVTTPSLLFPAISLLLLAYTNRFLAIAALIRSLHDRYQAHPDKVIIAQLDSLRYRVKLIRNMQGLAALSLLLCVVCMILLFFGQVLPGKVIFGLSMVIMVVSLGMSIREIQVSVDALNLELRNLETQDAGRGPVKPS